MPARWESSQRPLFVKTVWIDGYRHAILTRDDPANKRRLLKKSVRPTSSVSYAGAIKRDPALLTVEQYKQSRLSHNQDQLEECFRKLRLVITDDNTSGPKESQTLQYHDNNYTKEDESSVSDNLDSQADTVAESEAFLDTEREILVLQACAQPIYELESLRSKQNTSSAEMKTPKNIIISPEEVAREREKNALSERVFQWLDLAGKIGALIPELESSRMAQPRHSCPEIQKRVLTHSRITKHRAAPEPQLGKRVDEPVKTKTYFYESKIEYGSAPNAPSSSNVIEKYARLTHASRDAQNNTAAPVTITEGSGSQNIVSRPRDNTRRQHSSDSKTSNDRKKKAIGSEANRKVEGLDMDALQKVAAEISDVERQYAELVGRGVRQTVKRQVHIFLPTLPKKTNASASTCRSGGSDVTEQ